MSEATPPSAKRRRLDLTESVKLVIGPERKELFVHKSVITKSSDFFKACCDGHNWKEASTKTVELPEDDPELLSAYVEWLYTGELVVVEGHVLEETGKRTKKENLVPSVEYFRSALSLAVYADKIGDLTLTNLVIDKMFGGFDCFTYFPGAPMVREVYAKLPSASPTRKLLVDVYYMYVPPAYMDKNIIESFGSEFVNDLLLRYVNVGPKTHWADFLKQRCKYHTHNDKVPKCA